ncbi:MAG: YqgE/AlgH family protein [Deltaproteobacteria bacterium]|nr:YqgE/AlgH family protein [Deltaproteobacteria bacterium]
MRDLRAWVTALFMVSDLERLAPGFVVAAPSLDDPNFDHTVVLLCAHSDQGAMGIVINRQAPISLNEIMHQLDLAPQSMDPRSALFGGPVAPQHALLLYQHDEDRGVDTDGSDKHAEDRDENDSPESSDEAPQNQRPPVSGDHEIEVGPRLRLSPGREILRAMAQGEGPHRVHLFLGHAGWAPGQLEHEIAQGAWIPIDLNLDLIFDVPLADRWEQSLRQNGLRLAGLSTYTPQS